VGELAYCRNCNGFREPGKKQFCSDDCREEWTDKKRRGIGSKMTILKRILEGERTFPKDDPMMYSEGFIEAILMASCCYCGTSLGTHDDEGKFQGIYTGINLDRIHDGKHNSWNITGCCPLCNRLKSSEEFGFTFMEMGTLIGPAVKAVRIRRGNTRRN
jgi:hypothetical protein